MLKIVISIVFSLICAYITFHNDLKDVGFYFGGSINVLILIIIDKIFIEFEESNKKP